MSIKAITFFFFIIICWESNAQKDSSNSTSGRKELSESDTTVYVWVDEMPNYKGGEGVFATKVARKVPTKFKEEISRIFISVIIEKDGTPTHIKIIQPADKPELRLSQEFAAKIKGVVESCGKWRSGMQKGKPVRSKVTVPINLNSEL